MCAEEQEEGVEEQDGQVCEDDEEEEEDKGDAAPMRLSSQIQLRRRNPSCRRTISSREGRNQTNQAKTKAKTKPHEG